MTVVLAFGTFDPLHEGHRHFFRQARALGEHLLVVVARDAAVRRVKHRQPAQTEAVRLAAVQAIPDVSEARLGESDPERYTLLTELTFDVLALGYDQLPDDATARRLLNERGKQRVRVVRLQPYLPRRYKGVKLRGR